MTQTDQEIFRAQKSRGEFPTTQWNVVLTATNPAAPLAGEALEKLCRTYWPPVYAFIRRQSQCPEDAMDLTQAFFAHFLEKEQFKRADPQRGRLRSFLLISINNFLADEWAYAQAEKRGGGRALQSLDQPDEAEAFFLTQVADLAAPPDRAYELEWAFTLLDQTISVLRQQSAATDGLDQFEAIKELVWGGSTVRSQVEIATQLGITPNALGVAVHRLRRRYGKILREAIGQTVADPAEIDGELRHLIAVISA